jgi:hypothetical protein
MRCLGSAWFAAGVLLMTAPSGFAQPTAAEFKCQQMVTKAGAKFVVSKMKCVSNCFKEFWAGEVPMSDCIPPTYGGDTARCIDDTVSGTRGAENKLSNAITRACDPGTKPGTECPDCYGGGDCSASGFAAEHVADLESQVDSFVFGVMCEIGANGAEQKCQVATAKLIAKHENGVGKCYAKCRSNERKGLIAPESCAPPATDPATIACLEKITAKTTVDIDKYCVNAAHAVPDCVGTDDYPSGATWAHLANAMVAFNQPQLFCDSTTTTSMLASTSTSSSSTTTSTDTSTSSTSTSSTSTSSSTDPNATTSTTTSTIPLPGFDFTSTEGTGTCGHTFRDLAGRTR